MPTPGLNYLLTAPGDAGSGVACVVDIETTGPDPQSDEIIEIALSLFAYKRNSGKFIGIVDEYVGQREPAVPISSEAFAKHKITMDQLRGEKFDMRRVDYILLRTELIIAHDTAVKRPFLLKLSELAAQRPWRCSRNSINWVGVQAGNGTGLQELLDGHRIKIEHPNRALDDVHGLLLLLGRTDDRGRAYLGQLI